MQHIAMRTHPARISEIGWEPGIGRTAWVDCPPAACPPPGRYSLAWSPEEPGAPLAAPLFACRYKKHGFQAAAPIPGGWGPGTPLFLRGPFGRGFTPPAGMRRLALAALGKGPAQGDGAARLLPLLGEALENGAAAALFCDAQVPQLPAAVEINPLAALAEGLAWADYLAFDLAEGWEAPDSGTGQTPGPLLQRLLGFDGPPAALPCPAQALVHPPMPCAGIAACGVCAVQTRRGWKLACETGPVFDLMELFAGGH